LHILCFFPPTRFVREAGIWGMREDLWIWAVAFSVEREAIGSGISMSIRSITIWKSWELALS
jgi:hypothetical protein